MKSVFTVVLMLIVLVLTGCYMDVPQSEGSVSFNIQSRSGTIGDFGNGAYVVARIYYAETLEPLISNNPEIVANGGIYDDGTFIYYTLLPTPSMINVVFAGSDFPDTGSFTMPVLSSSKQYCLLVEYYNYWDGDGFSPYKVGISDPFEVLSSSNTIVDINLVEYSFPY
jgi:hypothetical protein